MSSSASLSQEGEGESTSTEGSADGRRVGPVNEGADALNGRECGCTARYALGIAAPLRRSSLVLVELPRTRRIGRSCEYMRSEPVARFPECGSFQSPTKVESILTNDGHHVG